MGGGGHAAALHGQVAPPQDRAHARHAAHGRVEVGVFPRERELAALDEGGTEWYASTEHALTDRCRRLLVVGPRRRLRHRREKGIPDVVCYQ